MASSSETSKKSDPVESERKRRYEQRKAAYNSNNAVDGRGRVDQLAKNHGEDPLLKKLQKGRR